MLFQDLGPRKVIADFSGGHLSNDGGALLLQQVDAGLGISRMKRYLLDRARLLRPALGMKRVSNAAVHSLEGKLRMMADELIRQHPSMGRTIKP